MDQMTNTTAPQRATLRSQSVAETQRLGALLGSLLEPGAVVLLEGDLGAGKTALTQGIAVGLDIPGTVNSPTFTILKEYFGRLPLYHFDLYRIESPDEVTTLGFEDYFDSDGVSVIEWAERGEYMDTADAPDTTDSLGAAPDADTSPWPADWLRIALAPAAGEREARDLTLSAHGSRGQALLAAFIQAAADAPAPGQNAAPTAATGGADAAGD